MSTYITIPSDIHKYGMYRNANTPNTQFSDELLEEYALDVEDEIHAALTASGIICPLSASINPSGFRRLQTLSRIGLTWRIEEELVARVNKVVEKGTRGFQYREKFEKLLEKYCENPKYMLLAGDSDFTCLSSFSKIQPRGTAISFEFPEVVEVPVTNIYLETWRL